jgi:hypothetical protein
MNFSYDEFESAIVTSIGIEKVQGEPVFVIITSKGDKILTKKEAHNLEVSTLLRILALK